jgi:hypothetical protein
MMRLSTVGALGALVMVGCQSTDGAAIWSADYNARYDVLASCLAGQYAANRRFYTSQRRIDVVVPNPSTREPAAEFQISQVTDVISKVTWRRFSGGLFRGAMNQDDPVSSRSQADRCARPA